MSEIDPLIAQILLKGDDEFLEKLKKVGEDGAKNFENLYKAVESGASSAQLLTGALGLIEAAIAATTAATVAFIEQQTALTQKTELLSAAFGTTSGQLQEIEATFASSGVTVEQFERFANRLTITIAREWPAISEAIKTYATDNDAAMLRVSQAILGVQDAQKALADNSEERAAQIARDNNSLAQSYIQLQFAAAHSASEQVAAAQSVRGAELSSASALQHLQELQGNPPSAAQKQTLAIAQAQQAVDQARRAEADARIAQQEKAAAAALKLAQQQQAYDDLARKAAKNARDDAEQRQKDENRVKQAIIQRAEAEQKANQFALTNVVSIRTALDGIVDGNKAAATAIDLTQVSVENLKRAIIAQAAEANKDNKAADGFQTLISFSQLLAKDTGHLISQEERLAVVNRLAATSMQAIGSSGAEILDVIENNSEAFKRIRDSVDKFNKEVDPEVIKKFRGALAELNLQISLTSQRFAAAVAPAFTKFLDAVRESLTETGGVLHTFVDGLNAIGRGLSAAGEQISEWVASVAKAFDTTPMAIWKGLLVTIGVLIAAAASAILAWPIIIATVVTAVGYIADNWDKVKKGIADAWSALTNNAVVNFLSSVFDWVGKIAKAIGALFGAATKLGSLASLGGSGGGSGGGNASESGDIQGNAAGGLIRGPGSGTSDSILSRLSNGEFVVKAAAVQAYGAGLFHALNNMQLPGFASGGLVASPVRMSGGGIAPATSTLNLSIDGRTFTGLKGPKSTIDDLSSFAIARQVSSAGSAPSWLK